MNIGITGSTGLLGRAMASAAAAAGHTVIAYTRQNPPRTPILGSHTCLVSTAEIPLPPTRLDALIHLSGENLLGLWTPAKRRRLWSSRVQFTQRLVENLAQWPAELRPKVLLCASGAAYYGSQADASLTETSPAGEGFLAELCAAWEGAARQAEALGIRVIPLRTGMVISPQGGAYPLMRLAFKLGLGGRLGSGQQWVPWIHHQDYTTLALWAAQQPGLSGPLNFCAPAPLTNAELTRTLAQHLRRPAFMHAPAWLLRLLLPGLATEMLLCSQRILPQRALDAGFQFRYPSWHAAITGIDNTASAAL
jgi:uncharacterized protein